ncbi:uncharacterized protein LOC126681771 [Mercurialis annua]|uniref:uncharacterized protein LOC126681771 n=1 Tax=Mercurialis annua TaxID=3986 RepID=UPI00215F40B4|nr:uncharacterized protein LOC126681771 [Mercurialis annua]
MATEIFFITLKPFLDGSNYKVWKYMMENYLDMQGVDLLSVFLRGWTPPCDKNGVLLKSVEWSKEQEKENGMSRKDITTLLSSIAREEQGRIQHLNCAKQMWETLESYYEGTHQVKGKKLEFLLGEYEGFKGLSNEDVSSMTSRLLKIVHSLEQLGKFFKLNEINGKILRSLPILLWQPKTTAIIETHDLSTLRTDEFIGKLLLHDMSYIKLIQAEMEKEKSGIVAFKASTGALLKENKKESNEEELLRLTKRVNELKMKGNGNHGRSSSSRKSSKGGSKTFWDGDSQSDGDSHHDVNLCLMSFEEESTLEVNPQSFLSWDGIGVESHDACINVKNDIVDDIVDDDAQDGDDDIDSMLDELVIKCGDYKAKMLFFKNEASKAKDEMLVLTKEFHEPKFSNEVLKSSLESIPKQDSLSRFQKGKATLDTILVSQRCPTIKHGLGYNQNSSSSNRTIFVKSTLPQTSSIEAPPKLVKPIGAKKVHVQALRPKPFLAQKAKSNKGTKPSRHGNASQYSHKWKKKTRKNSHVHAFLNVNSCSHVCACSYETSRAKPPQMQSNVQLMSTKPISNHKVDDQWKLLENGNIGGEVSMLKLLSIFNNFLLMSYILLLSYVHKCIRTHRNNRKSIQSSLAKIEFLSKKMSSSISRP